MAFYFSVACYTKIAWLQERKWNEVFLSLKNQKVKEKKGKKVEIFHVS